jgi:ketosteroid isomerase-like protein
VEDRYRAALAAVLAVLALGGCGSGDKKASSDPDAVRATVTEFSKAFGSGDGTRACDLMTPEAQAAFVKRVQSIMGTKDCAKAIEAVHGEAGAQANIAFSDATVSNVKVTGGSATAVLTASGHSATAKLLKQGAAWKLTGVPGI